MCLLSRRDRGQGPHPKDRDTVAACDRKPVHHRVNPLGSMRFDRRTQTVLRWLGMAGFLINTRGTMVMIDPLLGGFDMPVLIDYPITTAAVPQLDAVLVTHSDNDHYSVPTCRLLAPATAQFHSTQYVNTLMRSEGFPSTGHDIGDSFAIGPVTVTVTPADHAWQNESPGVSSRIFQSEDCCGFWLETPDGALGARGLATHPRPSPAHAPPGRDALRLFR